MRVRTAVWLTVGLVAAGGVVVGARQLAGRRAEAALFRPAPAAGTTPAAAGLAFRALRIPSGDRQLAAWLVPAPDSARSAVLFFHGNGSSLADQVPLLAVLVKHGVTAMAFDYSGYGTSGGAPSVAHLREDAIAAVRTFTDSTPGLRHYALGTTLGAAVMLSAVDSIGPMLDGMILVGAFATARDAAVRAGKVPRAFAWLLPDWYDNVDAIARLRRPVLIEHSVADSLVPIRDAERLLGAAGGAKQLVRLTEGDHASYLSTNADWIPILRFIGAR